MANDHHDEKGRFASAQSSVAKGLRDGGRAAAFAEAKAHKEKLDKQIARQHRKIKELEAAAQRAAELEAENRRLQELAEAGTRRAPAADPAADPAAAAQPEFGRQGAKIGSQLRIRLPNDFIVERCIEGLPQGRDGMTPDHVKASAEFRKAKADFDQSFSRLRSFNDKYLKAFGSEIKAERAAKRGQS